MALIVRGVRSCTTTRLISCSCSLLFRHRAANYTISSSSDDHDDRHPPPPAADTYRSEPGRMEYMKSDYLLPPRRYGLASAAKKPASNEYATNRANFAVNHYNKLNKTNFEFLRVVKASCHIAAGVVCSFIMEVKDNDDGGSSKLYRAQVQEEMMKLWNKGYILTWFQHIDDDDLNPQYVFPIESEKQRITDKDKLLK